MIPEYGLTDLLNYLKLVCTFMILNTAVNLTIACIMHSTTFTIYLDKMLFL